jgi:hypothetical protein
MNDATEDPKVNKPDDRDYSGVEEMPEMVEPVKPNRHERRKQAKLARMLAMKEKLEAARRGK